MSQELLYSKHAATLLRTFDQWKHIDRFYFIPLNLDMSYHLPGSIVSMAPQPYYLGTILRNSLENPELFSTPCECGHTAYAYAYNGSPITSRVDLSYACPRCGKHTHLTQTGWRIRSKALQNAQSIERSRLIKTQLLHPKLSPATIQELIQFCEK